MVPSSFGLPLSLPLSLLVNPPLRRILTSLSYHVGSITLPTLIPNPLPPSPHGPLSSFPVSTPLTQHTCINTHVIPKASICTVPFCAAVDVAGLCFFGRLWPTYCRKHRCEREVEGVSCPNICLFSVPGDFPFCIRSFMYKCGCCSSLGKLI